MEANNRNSRRSKSQSAAQWGLSTIASLRYFLFAVISVLSVFSVITIPEGSARILVPQRKDSIDKTEMPSEFFKFSTENDDADTCVTSECYDAASQIISKMDPGVDPCDNFYKFACGKFLNTTVIPKDEFTMDAFAIIEHKVNEQLRTCFEAEDEINEPKAFGLVKKFYRSCMNTDVIEARGFSPLLKIFEVLGGWPVVEGSTWKDEKAFDWMSVAKKFLKIGYEMDFPMSLSVSIDPSNSTRHVITLNQAHIDPPRDYLIRGFNDTLVQAYYSYMVDIAVYHGASRERAMEDLREMLLFQINLANITRQGKDSRNATRLYNPMSLADLTDEYPGIPWRRYLNDRLSSGLSVRDDESIVVAVPEFISDVLKLIDVTSKRVLANYIVWGFVRGSNYYMHKVVRERKRAYEKALFGAIETKARWKECVVEMTQSLPLIVGAMYTRKYFNEESRNKATDMVMDIRRQFENMLLREVEWLDEETRERALKKAIAITNHIGYPDELLDDVKVQEIYQNLELSDYDYFENGLNVSIFEIKSRHGKLRKSVIKKDWMQHGDTALVNAFYKSQENSIDIPAGILQDAFFNPKRPRYMNYASIGFFIAHEIVHGFDDEGRQYDKTGNVFDWWETSTKERYIERAKCIIEQYGNYTVDEVGMRLNGINTQGENIADNGGVRVAYGAYVNWSVTNDAEKKLPGLDYTPKKMFWISLASTWCSVYRTEFIKFALTYDSHSPAEFRINGALSNAREFSQDFECPIGSKMNSTKKCTIW